MMLQQGMRLLVIGLAVGLAGAFALSRVVRSLLFEVNASDSNLHRGQHRPRLCGGRRLLDSRATRVAG